MIKYINRDGDTISFERQGETVIMRGYREYYRVSYGETKDEIYFIDPSGGPMIVVGDDLGDFGKQLKNCVVKSIKIGNQFTTFNI